MIFIFSLFLVLLALPAFASGAVVGNEIAWMGTETSANDEWIELYNNGSESIDLSGWRIVDAINGSPDIAIGDACIKTTISAGGYFLLERSDDDSVPGISADCIYTGALSNSGEHLQLIDAGGNIMDSVNAADGWPAGDNTTKETMQKSGGGWVTAQATPKAANAVGGSTDDPYDSGSETNTGDTSKSSNSSNQSGSSSGGSSAYVPPEDLPRITANAGKDTSAIVGEEIEFRGMAFGLEGEPMEHVRYLWNFGDGGTREGQNVGHAYMFPGTYMVRLTISSGKYTAFDGLAVSIGEGGMIISEAKPGMDGWIELQNKGIQAIHVGNWIIESSAQRFIFPQGTTIAPGSFAVLSAATTKLILEEAGDAVHLFYPNGSFANGFSYVFQVPAGMSISNNEGVAIFTNPTPGKPNAVPALPPVQEPLVQKRSVAANVLPPTSTKPTIATKITLPAPPIEPLARASVFDAAPPPSQKNSETIWFAGSLIAGGLLAVAVVFLRRKRNSVDI